LERVGLMLNKTCNSLFCPCGEIPFAATLTVYTSAGTFTVENVREDSIVLDGTTLKAEEDDGQMRLFTFINVGGYSTILC
jgi:hypothetical protein